MPDACDWLEDRMATLADVVRLYALPPEWRCPEEELPKDAINCPRCGGLGLLARPEEDDSLRPLLIAWCLRVKAWEVTHHHRRPLVGEFWRVWHNKELDSINQVYLEPAARRALKRAVLWEFDGDVRVPGNLPEALFFATARTLEERRRMAWRSLEINGMSADGIFERDDGRMMTLLRYAPVKPSALIPPEINSGIAVGEFPDQTFMRNMLAADGAPVIHDPRYLIRGSE